MTALKPLETRRVVGQIASRYPLNMFCAVPDCPEPALDAHHIFPRSEIGSTLWFVQAWDEEEHELFSSPLAHVVGLCRAHHDAVEQHDAWIKLEEIDGILVFIWYDRVDDDWAQVGKLDPQPGGREKLNRPKRRRFRSDDEIKKRKSVSIKLPLGVDGLYWKELLDEAGRVELEQEDTPFDRSLGKVTTGKLLVTILERYTGRAAA